MIDYIIFNINAKNFMVINIFDEYNFGSIYNNKIKNFIES